MANANQLLALGATAAVAAVAGITLSTGVARSLSVVNPHDGTRGGAPGSGSRVDGRPCPGVPQTEHQPYGGNCATYCEATNPDHEIHAAICVSTELEQIKGACDVYCWHCPTDEAFNSMNPTAYDEESGCMEFAFQGTNPQTLHGVDIYQDVASTVLMPCLRNNGPWADHHPEEGPGQESDEQMQTRPRTGDSMGAGYGGANDGGSYGGGGGSSGGGSYGGGGYGGGGYGGGMGFRRDLGLIPSELPPFVNGEIGQLSNDKLPVLIGIFGKWISQSGAWGKAVPSYFPEGSGGAGTADYDCTTRSCHLEGADGGVIIENAHCGFVENWEEVRSQVYDELRGICGYSGPSYPSFPTPQQGVGLPGILDGFLENHYKYSDGQLWNVWDKTETWTKIITARMGGIELPGQLPPILPGMGQDPKDMEFNIGWPNGAGWWGQYVGGGPDMGAEGNDPEVPLPWCGGLPPWLDLGLCRPGFGNCGQHGSSYNGRTGCLGANDCCWDDRSYTIFVGGQAVEKVRGQCYICLNPPTPTPMHIGGAGGRIIECINVTGHSMGGAIAAAACMAIAEWCQTRDCCRDAEIRCHTVGGPQVLLLNDEYPPWAEEMDWTNFGHGGDTVASHLPWPANYWPNGITMHLPPWGQAPGGTYPGVQTIDPNDPTEHLSVLHTPFSGVGKGVLTNYADDAPTGFDGLGGPGTVLGGWEDLIPPWWVYIGGPIVEGIAEGALDYNRYHDGTEQYEHFDYYNRRALNENGRRALNNNDGQAPTYPDRGEIPEGFAGEGQIYHTPMDNGQVGSTYENTTIKGLGGFGVHHGCLNGYYPALLKISTAGGRVPCLCFIDAGEVPSPTPRPTIAPTPWWRGCTCVPGSCQGEACEPEIAPGQPPRCLSFRQENLHGEVDYSTMHNCCIGGFACACAGPHFNCTCNDIGGEYVADSDPEYEDKCGGRGRPPAIPPHTTSPPVPDYGGNGHKSWNMAQWCWSIQTPLQGCYEKDPNAPTPVFKPPNPITNKGFVPTVHMPTDRYVIETLEPEHDPWKPGPYTAAGAGGLVN